MQYEVRRPKRFIELLCGDAEEKHIKEFKDECDSSWLGNSFIKLLCGAVGGRKKKQKDDCQVWLRAGTGLVS